MSENELPDDAFDKYHTEKREVVSKDEQFKLEVKLHGCLKSDWWAASIYLYRKRVRYVKTTEDAGPFGLFIKTVTKEKESWGGGLSSAIYKSTRNGAKDPRTAVTKARDNIIEKMKDDIDAAQREDRIVQEAREELDNFERSFDPHVIFSTSRRLHDDK